jgi:hypothetical protein
MGPTQTSKSRRALYVVYVGILILAVFQVVIALLKGPSLLFMILVASLQAWCAVMYFMHLKEERPSLILALIPYTIFVLLMMNMIWSDSFRLLRLRPH